MYQVIELALTKCQNKHFLPQSRDRIRHIHSWQYYQIRHVLYVNLSEKLGLATHQNVELVELLLECLDR